MRFATTPSGHRLLLVWRTEFLFYTPERRRLAGEWNHVRLTSAPLPEQPSLINHSLNQPLPLPDEWFDAIYSFHVVEHLNPAANERFVRDIHRLLKPGGIYRVSTPDLEFLATEYLQRLHNQMASASVENYARYRWAVCNLIDQCAREVSGGEMMVAIRRGEFTPEHVKHMNGDLLDFLFRPPPSAFPAPSAPVRLLRAEVVKRLKMVVRKVAGPFGRRRLGDSSRTPGSEPSPLLIIAHRASPVGIAITSMNRPTVSIRWSHRCTWKEPSDRPRTPLRLRIGVRRST